MIFFLPNRHLLEAVSFRIAIYLVTQVSAIVARQPSLLTVATSRQQAAYVTGNRFSMCDSFILYKCGNSVLPTCLGELYSCLKVTCVHAFCLCFFDASMYR